MSYLFSEENQDDIASLFDSHNAGRLLAVVSIKRDDTLGVEGLPLFVSQCSLAIM